MHSTLNSRSFWNGNICLHSVIRVIKLSNEKSWGIILLLPIIMVRSILYALYSRSFWNSYTELFLIKYISDHIRKKTFYMEKSSGIILLLPIIMGMSTLYALCTRSFWNLFTELFMIKYISDHMYKEENSRIEKSSGIILLPIIMACNILYALCTRSIWNLYISDHIGKKFSIWRSYTGIILLHYNG